MKVLIKTCDWLFKYKDRDPVIAVIMLCTLPVWHWLLTVCSNVLHLNDGPEVTECSVLMIVGFIILICFLGFFVLLCTIADVVSDWYLKYRPMWFNKYVINEESEKYIASQKVKESSDKYNYMDI